MVPIYIFTVSCGTDVYSPSEVAPIYIQYVQWLCLEKCSLFRVEEAYTHTHTHTHTHTRNIGLQDASKDTALLRMFFLKEKKKKNARHILGGLQDALKDTTLLRTFLRLKVLDLG